MGELGGPTTVADASKNLSDRGGTNAYGLPIPGYKRSDHPGKLVLPANQRVDEIIGSYPDDESSEWDEFDDQFCETYCVTIHVIDIQSFQVMTLMDAHSRDLPINFFDDELDGDGHGDGQIWVNYGGDLPILYGLPPRGSPYHREFTETDFRNYHILDSREEAFPRGIANFSPRAMLDMKCGSSGLLSFDGSLSLILFSGRDEVVREPDVCNFLRALMKEKCVSGKKRVVTDASSLELVGPPALPG